MSGDVVWNEDPLLSSAAVGALGELRLATELVARGHQVARPFFDDDNVDLIVNYRRTVQVKAARRLGSVGQYAFQTKRLRKDYAHVDVLALWGMETDQWWLVPCAELFGRWPRAESLCFRPEPSSNGLVNVRTRWLEQWLDRWDVFE